MKKEISIGWDVGGWSGKNHGLCILEYDGNDINLVMATNVNIYDLKEKIEEILIEYQKSHSITIAIDAPLQFPFLFQEIIHSNPINIFDEVQKLEKANPIAWRDTDLYIKNHFQKTPLSASFSFLTSNATVAISLLGELKSKFELLSILPFDREKSIKAIEVYPGLLKSKILSKHKIFNQYHKLSQNIQFNDIEGFDYYFSDSSEKTDTADAVICAFYGLGFRGKVPYVPKIKYQIPSTHMESAQKEGWIYYPDIF
jgi:hypothetical protein